MNSTCFQLKTTLIFKMVMHPFENIFELHKTLPCVVTVSFLLSTELFQRSMCLLEFLHHSQVLFTNLFQNLSLFWMKVFQILVIEDRMIRVLVIIFM